MHVGQRVSLVKLALDAPISPLDFPFLFAQCTNSLLCVLRLLAALNDLTEREDS